MTVAPRRNRNVQIFESSIAKLARILSRKWGVKVVFQHGRCETEGKVIYLPVVPDSAPQELMDAMQGHLDHEVAHVVLTDFAELQKIKRKDKKLFTTLNALEDPRIERGFADLWPGARWNFNKSREWSLKKVAESHTDPRTGKASRGWDELSELGKVLFAATIYGSTAFDDNHWFLTDIVEPDVMTRLRATVDIIKKARAAATTAEVVELSREFLKALNEVEEPLEQIKPEDIGPDDQIISPQSPQDHVMRKKPPKPEPGQPKVIELEPPDPNDPDQDNEDGLQQPGGPQQPGGEDGGEEGESDDDSEGAPAGAGEAEDDGEEGDPTGQPSIAKSKKRSGSADPAGAESGGAGDLDEDAEAAEGEPDEDAEGEESPGLVGKQHGAAPTPPRMPKKLPPIKVTDQDLADDQDITDISRMIKEAAEFEIKGHDNYLVFTTEGDRVVDIKGGDKQQYRTFMTKATAMVAVMKRKLTRAMLSTAASSWEPDKLRGKINPRAAHRVALGTSKRVFRQRVESEKFDTAVQLMVDHSGSMTGDKLQLAAMTAIIIGEVCHQLGIAFSVCGFSTGDGDAGYRRQQKASAAERELYSRWDNQWIGMYKDFDEAWAQSNHRLITMPKHDQMNTYDGESLRLGAQRLLQRREKRKILFWLNDGQPCPTSVDDRAALIEYTAQCAKEVEKMVEVVAIGIMTDAVRQFYTNWVQVNNLEELPKVCLQKLSELLIKGKNNAQKKVKK